MMAKIGDRISIESQKVGRPAREGEILAISDSPFGTNYRVRWHDGHESEIRPSSGSARIIPQKKTRAPKAS